MSLKNMPAKYNGMTVNERLYISGLIKEFDQAIKNNKRRALEILQSVNVDDDTIDLILQLKDKIPKNRLLQAFCNYYPINLINSLKDFKLSKEIIDNIDNRKDLNNFFLFSNKDLRDYLKLNIEECNKLLVESYNKRSSPSTFISEIDSGFKVGYFDKKEIDVKIWDNIIDATADYLLLSWGLDRLI